MEITVINGRALEGLRCGYPVPRARVVSVIAPGVVE
jgi:hypothetical protein